VSLEIGEVVVGAEKGVLTYVGRGIGTNDSCCNPIDDVTMTRDQALEGAPVASASFVDELNVAWLWGCRGHGKQATPGRPAETAIGYGRRT